MERGSKPPLEHEPLVPGRGVTRRRRRQDWHCAMGWERTQYPDACVVRVLRTVRAAGHRDVGFRRGGRAVRVRSGAHRRRHHAVQPQQPRRDPRHESAAGGMRPTAWQRLDHLQPLLAGMLIILGLMTVDSAHADWVRQRVWVALGAAAYTAAAGVEYRRVDTLAPWLYLAMVGMLLAS